jgi:hypothetical protein
MNRQQKRKTIRDCQKQIRQINNAMYFLRLNNPAEFDLSEEEMGLLMDGIHRDSLLQERFNLAKELSIKVGSLRGIIAGLTNKGAYPATKEGQKSHLQI